MGSAGFPREFRMGVQNSIFLEGMPNFLGGGGGGGDIFFGKDFFFF